MYWKFMGVLSTTMASFAARAANRPWYNAPSSSSCEGVNDETSSGNGWPVRRFASLIVSSMKLSSPAPQTSGWLLRICSVSVVPDRGMPRTNTGRGRRTTLRRACAAESMSKARLMES